MFLVSVLQNSTEDPLWQKFAITAVSLARNPLGTLDFFLLTNAEVMQLHLNCFLEATIQSMWLRNQNKHSIKFSYIASNSRGDKL